MGVAGAPEQGWVDRDRTGRCGPGAVADRALPDGDEWARAFQGAQLRYHGRTDAVCARAGGDDVSAGHSNAAIGAGRSESSHAIAGAAFVQNKAPTAWTVRGR